MILGITGGIACGKSLAGNILNEEGLPIIDADEVSHYLTKYDLKVIDQIIDTFGECILTSHGQINRRMLAEIVFASPTERSKLEAILHPKIKKILSNVIEYGRRMGFNMVLVAPLLIEANFQHMVDVIWVISSEERIQAERLRKEYKLSEIDAYRRISAQLPLREKEAYADYVIYNNGSIAEFKKKVLNTWQLSLNEFKKAKKVVQANKKK